MCWFQGLNSWPYLLVRCFKPLTCAPPHPRTFSLSSFEIFSILVIALLRLIHIAGSFYVDYHLRSIVHKCSCLLTLKSFFSEVPIAFCFSLSWQLTSQTTTSLSAQSFTWDLSSFPISIFVTGPAPASGGCAIILILCHVLSVIPIEPLGQGRPVEMDLVHTKSLYFRRVEC